MVPDSTTRVQKKIRFGLSAVGRLNFCHQEQKACQNIGGFYPEIVLFNLQSTDHHISQPSIGFCLISLLVFALSICLSNISSAMAR